MAKVVSSAVFCIRTQDIFAVFQYTNLFCQENKRADESLHVLHALSLSTS